MTEVREEEVFTVAEVRLMLREQAAAALSVRADRMQLLFLEERGVEVGIPRVWEELDQAVLLRQGE
jgi:hypothetical protein